MANELDKSTFDILNSIPFHNETTEIVSLDKAICDIIADMGYYDDMFKVAFYQRYFGTSVLEKSRVKIGLNLFNTQFNGVDCRLLMIRFNDKNLKQKIPSFPKPDDIKNHLPLALFLNFGDDEKKRGFVIKLNPSLFVYKYINDVINYLKDADYLDQSVKYQVSPTKSDIAFILDKLSKSKMDKNALTKSYFYQYSLDKEVIYNGVDTYIIDNIAPYVDFNISELSKKMFAPIVSIERNPELKAIPLSDISTDKKNPLKNIHFSGYFDGFCRMYESFYDKYYNYFYIQERTFLFDLSELDEDKLREVARGYIRNSISPTASSTFYLNNLLFTSLETATLTKRIVDDVFAKALKETLNEIGFSLDTQKIIEEFKNRLGELINGMNERRENLALFIDKKYGRDVEVI